MSLWRRLDVQAVAVAAGCAFVWLVFAPRTPDLAAQSYRVGLFAREGFALWDNDWYAGHHLPGYSVLFPALGSLVGMRVVGAVAAVVSAFLLARIAGPRARLGVLWFAAATVGDLAIGRLTYALGVALGLAALYAFVCRRRVVAAVLGGLTAAATPLAGLFLAMAGASLVLAGPTRRAAVVLAAPALGVAIGMVALFPEGGSEPFHRQAFVTSVALGVAFVGLARSRVLRVGAGLYLIGTVVSALVSTPIGGNTTRLGAVFFGPVLLCAVGSRGLRLRPVVIAALAAMLASQVYAPVREIAGAVGDPLARPATYRGLLAFLGAHDRGGGRIEIPFTRSHWETAFVARRFPLARGWEKQLDVAYDGLFFAGELSPARYQAWLRQLAVRYVAVALAPADPSSRAEVGLVLGGLPYLRAVYRDRYWRVFRVLDPGTMASGGARLLALGPQSFAVGFGRAGASDVRVRFSPYWRASEGCVGRSPDGFTTVRSSRAGVVRVRIEFTLQRALGRSGSCRA